MSNALQELTDVLDEYEGAIDSFDKGMLANEVLSCLANLSYSLNDFVGNDLLVVEINRAIGHGVLDLNPAKAGDFIQGVRGLVGVDVPENYEHLLRTNEKSELEL